MNTSETVESHRFKRYSDSIDIKKLERETTKILYLGFVVAFAFYGMLGSLVNYKKTEIRVVKPIEVRLIVRPPRMTKPFVIEKKVHQQKALRKEVVKRVPPGAFRYRELESLREMLKLLDSLEYDYNIGPEVIAGVIAEIDSLYYLEYKKLFEWEKFDFRAFVEDAPDYDEGITREMPNLIALKDMLMSGEDYDTGQYKGLVVKDPADKQNLKGYIYIPVDVWGSILRPVASTYGLMQGFVKYTGINVKIDPHVFIDSPALLKYPFIYLSAGLNSPFDISDREKENIKEYFSSGGLILFDPYSESSYFSMRKLISDACGGKELIAPIKDDHPLLHTFYDFEKMPVKFPALISEGAMDSTSSPDGVWLDDRLVAIIPPSPYSPFGKTWQNSESEDRYENPSFRLAVNIIVYSLIRDGSIAEQYINDDAKENPVRSEYLN
jgi:hypothetical protein